MALTTVSSDRLSTNVKNTNFTAAEKQDLTNDILPLTGQLGNRNIIINGAMTVSQKNGTSVVTGVNSTGYRIDRWTHQIDSINSAFSVSQSTDSPDGFANSYKIDVTTADTSLAAAHAHFFRQKIEGQNVQDFAKGTSSAKQFAVSFYVKTNKTGLYTVELFDVDNSRAISKTFTVSDSNWNRYTLIYPADTTGAFANDNGNSLVLQFWLSAGSNYTSGTLNTSAWASATQANRVSSSNVNLGDNTSNEWYLTGVQLEVGDTVTSFEHRSYADELMRCFRYYQVVCLGSEAASSNAVPIISGAMYGTLFYGVYHLKNEMRTAPTMESVNGTNYYLVYRGGSYDECDEISTNNLSKYQCSIRVHNNLSGTSGDAGWARTNNGAAFAAFTAEL